MKYVLAKCKACSVAFVLYLSVLPSVILSAELQDVLVTDVSSKAFSVVWAADDEVAAANATVFADAEGSQRVHSAVVDVVSDRVISAHSQGLVKLSITGLESNSTYYVQLESATQKESVRFPLQPPYLEVTTATQATASAGGQPVVNELLAHEMISSDPLQSSRGRLVIVDLPGAVLSPLSAFVGEFSADERTAVVDLNNLLSFNGQRYEISQVKAQVITITELRGFQACNGLTDHKNIYYGFAPKDQNIPKVSKLSSAERCEQGDFNCDQAVDAADSALLASALGATEGDCLFNSHLDVVPDGVIDSYDHEKITSLRSQ